MHFSKQFSRRVFVFLSLFLIISSTLVAIDTLKIDVFDWDDESPEGWGAAYHGKANFPEDGRSWRKIIMRQTLKCDERTAADDHPCGEWDYITRTVLFIPNERDTFKEEFEIGSFITPYGLGLDLGEDGWSWEWDITDYAPLLKGEIEIQSGNNQELLDLDFLFIEGIPPRDPISVDNIYPFGNYKYGELADDSVLKAVDIVLDENATMFKIKSRITGHGHHGPNNCCEWRNKTHSLIINGWELDRWSIWTNCGLNPIYPQGGTWQFDREGWCPGMKGSEHEIDISQWTMPGDSLKIDYDIEMYDFEDEIGGEYRMTHQLISYGDINFDYDAEILDIIRPSSKKKYSRLNPSASNPVIVIRNNGRFPLMSLQIKYGFSGEQIETFNWSGNLAFMEIDTVLLPLIEYTFTTENRFEIRLNNPNNTQDQNPDNDFMAAIAKPLTTLSTDFVISLLTNNINRAAELSYRIFEPSGKVIQSMPAKSESFEDSTWYFDTLNLESQKPYCFEMFDAGEDGMLVHWWNRGGDSTKVGINGRLTFLDIEGDTLKKFHPDFAEKIEFWFITN